MRKATLKASIEAPAPNTDGDDDVAGQAGDARGQREQRDGRRGAQQVHGGRRR